MKVQIQRNYIVFTLEARLGLKDSIGPLCGAKAITPVTENDAPRYGVVLAAKDHSFINALDINELELFIIAQVEELIVVGIYLPP